MSELTDRQALNIRRLRAKTNPVDFLQNAVADELQERLIEVNRTFSAPAIVTGWPEVWLSRLNASAVPDDDVLVLETEAYDLVVHSLSLHWANDIVGQLVQCRRALQPDGLFLGTLFGGQTLHELRNALAEAEIELSGGLSPRIVPMADVRDLGGLLQRAGFALPVADTSLMTVSYETMYHLMHDIRGMGESNALSQRRKVFTNRALFERAAEIYAANFGGDNGRIEATFEIVTLTGWAPATSQPKPLKPGSASQRLAEALGTHETNLKRD